MEWSDFLESSFGPNLQALQITHPGWNYEENKMFENVLAELGFASSDLLKKVADRIPGKSYEEVVSHFAALVQDIEMIESAGADDQFLITKSRPEELGNDQKEGSSRSATPPISTAQKPRRGVPWTVQEHKLFLVGLIAFGKGDWRSMSRHCVKTRSPTQVASHAQKYFKRHSLSSASSSSSSSTRRKRCSIHDTQIDFDDGFISSLLSDIFHISDASSLLQPSSSSNNGKDNPISPPSSLITTHHPNPLLYKRV